MILFDWYFYVLDIIIKFQSFCRIFLKIKDFKDSLYDLLCINFADLVHCTVYMVYGVGRYLFLSFMNNSGTQSSAHNTAVLQDGQTVLHSSSRPAPPKTLNLGKNNFVYQKALIPTLIQTSSP